MFLLTSLNLLLDGRRNDAGDPATPSPARSRRAG